MGVLVRSADLDTTPGTSDLDVLDPVTENTMRADKEFMIFTEYPCKQPSAVNGTQQHMAKSIQKLRVPECCRNYDHLRMTVTWFCFVRASILKHAHFSPLCPTRKLVSYTEAQPHSLDMMTMMPRLLHLSFAYLLLVNINSVCKKALSQAEALCIVQWAFTCHGSTQPP